MIAHGKEVKVFCASASRPLAEGICKELGIPLGNNQITHFAETLAL